MVVTRRDVVVAAEVALVVVFAVVAAGLVVVDDVAVLADDVVVVVIADVLGITDAPGAIPLLAPSASPPSPKCLRYAARLSGPWLSCVYQS